MIELPEVAVTAATAALFQHLTPHLSPGERAKHWSERVSVYRDAAQHALIAALPYLADG